VVNSLSDVGSGNSGFREVWAKQVDVSRRMKATHRIAP
jgi:hypothetical protein